MWLMFGEGPMLTIKDKKDSDDTNSDISEGSEIKKTTVSTTNDQESAENSNLRALNQTQFTSQDKIYQQLEENKKILELQLQIEKMQKNPRRVSQITVYYDDSTFETFVPSKNK